MIFDDDGVITYLLTIRNLTITESKEDCVRLFGNPGGEIRNTTIANVMIKDRDRIGTWPGILIMQVLFLLIPSFRK